jgi:PEP-CTERM motif
MKPLTLLLVLALSSWCPIPAAADSIDLTGGTIHWSLPSSDFGTDYALTGPDFSVSGRAVIGFSNVSGSLLAVNGQLVLGTDVGYTLDFTHCEAFTACPTVTLDGLTYSPQTTRVDGELEIVSTATTISPAGAFGLVTAPFTALGTLVGRDRVTAAEVFHLTLAGQGLTTLAALGGPSGEPGLTSYFIFNVNYAFTPVPEPGTIGLVLAGLVGVGACYRRRQAGRVLLGARLRGLRAHPHFGELIIPSIATCAELVEWLGLACESIERQIAAPPTGNEPGYGGR